MILDYKNRWHLIYDIIFNSKKLLNNIIKEKEKIEQAYKDKLKFIQHDQYKNGIIKENRNQIELTRICNTDITPLSSHDNNHFVVDIVKKDVYNYSFKYSYMDESLSIEEIKKIISQSLSKRLIDDNYIHTKVLNKEIIFYINAF